MIWLTWRQHRAEVAAVAGILSLLGVFVVVTGIQTHNFEGGLACLRARPPAGCNGTVADFQRQFGGLESLAGWFNLIPAIIGVFVGAPLVAREIERGTFRVVWTQSIARSRWALVKVGGLVLLGVAAAAVMSALMTWWREPFDLATSRLEPGGFDFEGLVPYAYFLFALSLGLVSGTMLRRTVPAMVVTLVVFLGVRLPIEDAVRSHYVPPVTAALTAASTSKSPPGSAGGWVLDGGIVDANGRPVYDGEVNAVCGVANRSGSGVSVDQGCLAAHGFVDSLVYQPADRFWEFQFIEAGLFAGLSFLGFGLSLWWIRSRLR